MNTAIIDVDQSAQSLLAFRRTTLAKINIGQAAALARRIVIADGEAVPAIPASLFSSAI
jgi:hypothetical protein